MIPKPRIKDLLAAHGLSPRKVFGQNFMVDRNFAAAIARECRPAADTLVLEIGPGTGCLTEALLETDPAARVLAIEIDHGLAKLLREHLAAALAQGRLTVLEGDVLASKHQLAPLLVETALAISRTENRPRRVLCSNLPYNVATPVLANLAADTANLGIEAAVVTVQLELAERFQAPPGSKAYGALAAFLALRAKVRIVRRVGGEIFWPQPKVDSAVVELVFRTWPKPGEAGLQQAEAPAFQVFLQQLFSRRRKTLRAALKPLRVPELPGISPAARAEDVGPELLLALFRAGCGTQSAGR